MLRTFAVLLLLLGLATATPMVCLCAQDGVIGFISQPSTSQVADRVADMSSPEPAASASADTSSLLLTSAAAAVGSVIATAAGVPSAAPWSLPQPVSVARVAPLAQVAPPGLAWAPDSPPPQTA